MGLADGRLERVGEVLGHPRATAIAQAVALSFMGVRPESWPKERWSEMAVFFSQIEYKATEQWKEEIVLFDPGKDCRSSAAERPAEAVFPDGTPARLLAGPGSARGFRRLADRAEESLVRAEHRQPRLVVAVGTRHHPRAGRHPPGQSAEQSRTAGLSGAGIGRARITI